MIKVAHIIMAHKEPLQLERLIYRLQYPHFDLFVHLDKKVNLNSFIYLKDIANVHFIQNRTLCNWGGFSFVKAITNSVKEVLNRPIKYAYINLLSAQDYPIKNNDFIYNHYLQHEGTSFVSFDESNNTEWWQKAKSRYEKFHFTDVQARGKYAFQRLFNQLMPKRKFPLPLTLYGAAISSWWTVTSDCAEYIVDYLDSHPDLTKFMKYTWGADEFLYSTIIMNSKFKNTVVNDNFRFIEWESDSAHPKILKSWDYDRLVRAPHLFARKFDVNVDSAILNKLDKFLDNDQ